MPLGLALAPAILLVATLICVIVVRTRSTAIKLGTEVVLLGLIGGLLLSRGLSPLPGNLAFTRNADAPLLRALAVVWWLVAARAIAILTTLGLGHDARSKHARLFSDLLAGAIYLTAILIILNSVLGLPIKGLLATSGVIAIVLGLALQNTLADVFSGVAVGLEQPFHVGDRITLADHAEGIVVEMNWRSIRIQTDGEDVAIIPNSIVARSQIINRSVPTARRAVSLDIPTLSQARSEHLIELVRQAIMLCPSLLDTPTPSVFVKYIGTRTTMLGVNYFVASTSAMTLARSELLRQTRRLFRHAGIQDGAQPTDKALLGSIELFESLDDTQLGVLAAGLHHHILEPGAVLFEQGGVGSSLFVVNSGIFEIASHTAACPSHVYGKIGPGEYLGEISMMSGEPRPVGAKALTKASALELPKSVLEGLLRDNPELSAALERSVERGLALLDRDTAARTCEPLDVHGNLLSRIVTFLGISRGQPR
ncbi:mechanosensitive ion channel [Polymorphobacter sp. PAMC 29334]|uniref:mechanosensitive ion channel family protein n=1 Tax=Polymorphobacter sp. PAMC 29334 TaxID=2862331 RepID=UPI001C76657B|nr:mechanosensitive ion channel family protein [Polymorphobacter sp. PAMC 29334]QYE34713.1 mechanosensitive ion channel [Polymorphobacter sp. PAMC 29334]